MQEGSVLMVVKTELPKETVFSMATALRQIHTHHIEIRTADHETNYLVHPHPNVNSVCRDNYSLVMNMYEFVETERLNKDMLSSGALLTSATLLHLGLQASPYNMKSPTYFSTMHFPISKANAE